MTRGTFRKLTLIAATVICALVPMTVNAISEATMMFLAIEPGSRANGMGNAYVGVVEDAYAGWWNPASTAFNKKTQFAGMHTNWLAGSGVEDLYYEYFGWNQYFEDIGNLGLNIVWMDYGSQERRDEFGNYLGTFSSNEFAASAIYGSEIITNKLGIGLGFKFLYSNLGPGTGQSDTKGMTVSYAFDVSTKAKNLIVPRFDLGVVMQNIGPDVTYINDEQKDPLPMTLRLGLAYRVFDTITPSENPGPLAPGMFKQKLTISADASKILANRHSLYRRVFTAMYDDSAMYELDSAVLSAGIEYNYLDLISLRSGYFYDKAGSIVGPSFGVGFHYAFSEKYRLSADFAMVTAGELVDYNKTFSLGLDF